MKKVYSAPNAMLARHLVMLLDNAGIRAEVLGEQLESQDVGLGTGVEMSTMPSVWIVDDDQAEAALAIVRDFETHNAHSDED